MNVSYKWLRQYTPVDVDEKTFVHEMCMTGTEVTGYEKSSDIIKNCVVGKILDIQKHENADKLVVCQVDIGRGEPIQIVTAATNVFAGAVVPVALDGSTLFGGINIKKGKLRGVLSDGMFCSVSELGLTVADYDGAIEDGILILKDDTPIGEDICAALGLDDTVFIADIATNRPDCLSIRGIAREAAVTFDKPYIVETPSVKGEGVDVNDYLTVTVEDPELCPRYSARVVTDIKIAPSPKWMVERLRSCGIRSINNIVDITNYVMLEYGQPMHAFDYSCLKGGKINVRRAKEGEKTVTLDGQERTLASDMLVIADAERAVAVAGIMGGENSEIKDTTEMIVFESANFDGPTVRKGAKGLGMRTDASALFEKRLDPQMTVEALDRACELVEMLGAGKVSKDRKSTRLNSSHIEASRMPSLGMLTVNALAAADNVLIPVQAAYLPAKGLEQLLGTINKVKRQINPKLRIEGILLTMVDNRTNYSKDISNLIRESYGGKLKVYKTDIPRSVRAEEISAEGHSIFKHDPKGKVADAYRVLTKEVLNNAEKRRKHQLEGVR